MEKVYFISEINSDNLIRIFDALDVDLNDKVGVKISSGEPGGHNFLNPNLIKPLVSYVNGTLIECCTAYGGKRQDVLSHLQVLDSHGFSKIMKCDILDQDGEFDIPIENGFHLKKDIVGNNLKNYKSILVLSHFKGHAMGGFGGACKNISIGIASSAGKINIHSAGKTLDAKKCWSDLPNQDDFLESMADACKAVINYIGRENMVYINVANNLSVDCDCDGNPASPKMSDIGIFASIDPVALDKACYDAVKNSNDKGKKDLIERMDSRHAIHTLETCEKHNLGSMEYELVKID